MNILTIHAIEKVKRAINHYRKMNNRSPALIISSINHLRLLNYEDVRKLNAKIDNVNIIASENIEDDCMELLDPN